MENQDNQIEQLVRNINQLVIDVNEPLRQRRFRCYECKTLKHRQQFPYVMRQGNLCNECIDDIQNEILDYYDEDAYD